MGLSVRLEEPRDRSDIFAAHRRAFPTEAEALLVDALREGGFSRVSLVAESAGEIVGHVLFSDLPIIGPSRTVQAFSLAPVAVVPERQYSGIGQNLIRCGLETCRELGHGIIVVVGDPAYYGRFGFTAKSAEPLASIYSGPYLQALELIPGALDGVVGRVEYPPPFGALE